MPQAGEATTGLPRRHARNARQLVGRPLHDFDGAPWRFGI